MCLFTSHFDFNLVERCTANAQTQPKSDSTSALMDMHRVNFRHTEHIILASTSETGELSHPTHSLWRWRVNGYLAFSPCRWCLHLQSRLRRRPSSPPPPPRLSPPLPLHQSGLLHHHGDTHTPPLVSSASLAKQRQRKTGS